MGTRREQALDAAIRVLGTHGSRALTHRAVDTEAGLPAGSTSNHFRTREALLAGVLQRLSELERASWQHLTAQLTDPTVETFAHAVGRFARELADGGRTVTLARHAIFAEASVHDELRRQISKRRAEIESWGAGWFGRLGSPRPVQDLRAVLALLDGLLVHECTTPDPAFDPEPVIRALLTGLRATW
ncbi:TetR family transcriptional regulator [Saccharomonospora sp. NPDC046836]|uniref:TetR/AcrR family transcriptional regulator n=1 Tax=Saccharomonospora sp. NPDC046836 TaxID=3156921 RepID=UPI00340D6A0E